MVNSMDIDLNCCVTEEEEESNNGKGNSSISSSSLNSSLSGKSSIYMELWHACAGPLSTLPKKGNFVAYFPQGHLEQLGLTPFSPMEVPKFDLDPQVFCKVMDVQLLANKENDEVYTQVTLLPLTELELRNLEGKNHGDLGPDEEGILPAKTPHMFCKTLTASDTSTHGGFSVPRRAAEDCFPRLDYKQQRPSQELVAKDLHGVEWRFRHIYRGQPRRHLLTTGWSIFVSQKRLDSGDAVLFLRDENGDLRLGIRRAVRPRTGLPISVIGNQNYQNIISAYAAAVLSKIAFNVFYSPRATHADFVVPYEKYMKSISNLIPKGTRFKIKVISDDPPERSGVVTGICDLDPYRWPHSKWRCLRVRWDEDTSNNHQEQVSPWDIGHSDSLPPSSTNHSSPRLKKNRAGPQASPTDHFVDGRGSIDYKDSLRFPKVLQGQEKSGPFSPLIGYDKVKRALDFEMQHNFAHHQSFAPNWEFANNNLITTSAYTGFVGPTQSARVLQGQENSGIFSPVNGNNKVKRSLVFEMQRNFAHHQNLAPNGEFAKDNPTATTTYASFGVPPKVLQGQEICSLRSLKEKPNFALGAWSKPDLGSNRFGMYQEPSHDNFYPLASEGVRNMLFSNIKSYPQESVLFGGMQVQNRVVQDRDRNLLGPKLVDFKSGKDDMSNTNMDECKIFGFPLPVDCSGSNSQNGNKRTCTKVHKQGSLVGRAIDLSNLNSYNDLLIELERLFSMEGLLLDKKGWEILYTDSDNDMMAVGDDPWNEFCNVVSKIHIYTQEEVKKMNIGVISDDTHSCLEESPAAAAVSKSSSVGPPDSPPTAI